MAEDEETFRLFTDKKDAKGSQISLGLGGADGVDLDILSLNKADSEDLNAGTCLTLRVIQNIFTCNKKKGLWEPSQGNVFKAHEVEETKYPIILKVLEYGNMFDIAFVFTCLASIFLFCFSAGFIMKSKIVWGIIHMNNALYTVGLFGQWLRILITSKYGKTNQGYSKADVILSLVTVFPMDLIVLVIYNLNKKDVYTTTDDLIVSGSRINYLFRIYYVSKYFSIWENQLVISDSVMFLIRTTLYSVFMIHFFGCAWHAVACNSFSLKHFLMTPDEATIDMCELNSWINILRRENRIPLLNHPNLNVLGTHYLVSLYWATTVGFGLGLGDIRIFLTSNAEIVTTAITQITTWIFTLTVVNGTLTSLLVEGDTERESFLTRRFAIKHYLDFSSVGKQVIQDVKDFYDYLWQRRKGIMHLEAIDIMPRTMRTEVFYDVNQFVLNQLPLVCDMDQVFMMNLAVHVEHTFHLAGEILYRKNETGDCMRYVLKGYLEILCDDESRVIANIRSGSAIGEIHLIHPYPHVATVRCGSDCDILVLSKKEFKQLMKSYPEHWATFRTRMQERFDQSALLLSLCDKHNEYPRAFGKVDEKLRPYGQDKPPVIPVKRVDKSKSAQSVSKLQQTGTGSSKLFRDMDEFDGMNLHQVTLRRLSVRQSVDKGSDFNSAKHRKTLEEEAFKALETDVMRAGSLAKDLGIPRPPLLVTAPTSALNRPLSSQEQAAIKISLDSNQLYLVFRVFTAAVAMVAIWYYLYAIAFRSRTTVIAAGAFHVVDILFAVNFWVDMGQIVVTPQKTLEHRKEIFFYRLKSPSTYLRCFAFLPWEYLMTPLCTGTMFNINNPEKEFLFSSFKLNRLLEIVLIVQVLRELESKQFLSVIKMFILKFLIATVFTIHIFAVIFHLIHEYVYGWSKSNVLNYESPAYWSAQVTTATGFGDMLYSSDLEVLTLMMALVGGTAVVTYFGAKNAALLANSARRRVSFKQTFYCVKSFMLQRKFSKQLANRILQYYNVQWRAHEGTLIPRDRSVIWDAPESVVQSVTMAQAELFFTQVPLVQNCSESTKHSYAKTLKQYFVAPGETVLYHGDKRRELTFIVKGFCKVKRNGAIIGTFTTGNYFGLPGLIFGTNKEFEIVTETHCLFFCLLFEDFARLARSNHCILRDYKVLRGEAEFRKQRHELSPELLTQPGGIPIFYEKILKARDAQMRPTRKLSASGSQESIIIMEAEAENKRERSEDLGTWKRLKWIKMFMLLHSIHPDGKFIQVWTIFRTTIAVFVTIFVTATSAFAFHPGNSFIIMFLFDLVAWADIYVMLHLGYYGVEGQLITDRVMTAKNYILGPFFLDLVASFPFDYFLLPWAARGLNLFSPMHPRKYVNNFWIREVAHLRLLRSLQAYRLFLLGKLIEKTIFKSLTFITLVDVVPLMFLFIHISTCILAYFTCFWSVRVNDRCSSTNLILQFKPLNRHLQNSSRLIETPKNFDIFDPMTMYIVGLYWTMQTALSVGFGDFQLFDENNLNYFPAVNRIFAILIIILGSAVSLHLGSKLTACMVGEDSRKIAIREQMKVLFDFLGQYKVPKSIQRRVRGVYFNAWDKTKGISTTELFVALHPALQADVTKQLYEVQLRKSPILKDLDEAGIRMLSSNLKEVFYPEGEYVMKQGDLNEDVFIISTGIIVAYNVAGRIISYMAPGSIFGEISALFEVQRLYSAVAATDTDIFVFTREHFLEFLNTYPDMRKVIESACLLHYKETMEGAAQASGIEVILPVVDAREFDNESQDSGGLGVLGKEGDKVKETGDSTADLSTMVNNITYGEAKKNPHFIGDPLRVHLKITATANQTPSQKEDKPDKVDAEENYDQNNKWWSFLLTFGRIPRDEMGLIHINQERNKCNPLNFVIHPLCPLCSKALFMCICLLWTCLSCSLVTFDMAFRVSIPNSGWAPEDKATIKGVTLLVEIFFLLRFIGNFSLGYYDDDGVLVASKKLIIKHYASQLDGLLLDLIAFPYYLLTNNYFNASYSTYLKIFQLVRMFLFWRYLKETESELRMKTSMIKIIKISIILIFIFHFCSCIWYLIACDGFKCQKDSWVWRVMERIKIDYQLRPTDPNPPMYLSSYYCLSIFYVSTAITFTGLNYIEPAVVKEITLTVFFIFTTVFLIGFLVGEISQCLASQVATKIRYEHQLSVIQDHFLSLGLRRVKVKEVRNYYKLLWQKCQGIPYSKIMEGIPYSLRADIAFAIYGSNMKNSRILGKLDDTIIRQLCARVSHEIYLPGCRIVRSGDVCDAMYFIKRGEIVILDENQNMELCVETLYESECFGEVKLLLPKEQYRFSYITRLESEVGVLRREDLDDVMSNYPVLQNELADKAKKIKTHRITIREEEDRTKRIEMGIESEYPPGSSTEDSNLDADNTFEAAHADFLKRINVTPEGPGGQALRRDRSVDQPQPQ